MSRYEELDPYGKMGPADLGWMDGEEEEEDDEDE